MSQPRPAPQLTNDRSAAMSRCSPDALPPPLGQAYIGRRPRIWLSRSWNPTETSASGTSVADSRRSSVSSHSGYATAPVPSFGYLHTGHNSYNSAVTGAFVHSNLTTIVTNWRNAGIATIILGTCFPGVDLVGSEETERLAGNALILGDKCGADAVIDFAALAYFQNTANFPDRIHPDESGRILMAQAIVAVANPLVHL